MCKSSRLAMHLLGALVSGFVLAASVSAGTTPSSARDSLYESSASLPPTFLGQMNVLYYANYGQWDPHVAYRAEGSGATVWFTESGVYTVFSRLDIPDRESVLPERVGDNPPDDPEPPTVDYLMIRSRFAGSSGPSSIEAIGEPTIRAHYLKGNSQDWLTNVPGFRSIVYRQVYPGIDVRYHSRYHELEFDFEIAPGTDISMIKLEHDGVDSVSVDQSGNLVIATAWGEVVQNHPVAYQKLGNLTFDVDVEFTLDDQGLIGFLITGEYFSTLPLVIDPVLSFSTYLGGGAASAGYDLDIDGNGNIYVTGATASMDFPDTNAFQGTMGGGDWDAFVAKYGNNGETIEYATYLGGTNSDYGYGIAAGASGEAYVVGRTLSGDFPTQNPIFSASTNGDAFLVKLTSDGSALVYGTYIGGNQSDIAWDVEVFSSQAYLTGYTQSTDFPVLGAFQDSLAGGFDVFVTKVNSAGSALVYSTYIGGSATDIGQGITLDGSGRAVLTGYTISEDFPTAGAYQDSLTNVIGTDAFVCKLNTTGGVLTYGTYFGGTRSDFGEDIVLGTDGSYYLVGRTLSFNLPLVSPLQNSLHGDSDVLLARFNNQGTTLLFSTYLGGDEDEFAGGIDVDASGRVFVTGRTSSPDFPNFSASQETYGGGAWDAFVLRLNASLNQFDYSTFLGGDSADEAYSLVAGPNDGYAYFTGQTKSANFPVKRPLQGSLSGAADAFVALVTGDCADMDEDTVCDTADNCPMAFNPLQEDSDGDDIGDSCDVCPFDPNDDSDGDGFCANEDNCPTLFNPGQEDPDGDGVGTACDNCPNDFNPQQFDTDEDDLGDSCDVCPLDFFNDFDNDGICGDIDNCPGTFNPGQEDLDSNGVGDACEGCCVGLTGNVDCSTPDETPTLGDLTAMIDFLFITLQPLCCQAEANTDASAGNDVTLGDLTALIDNLFISLDPLPPCQ